MCDGAFHCGLCKSRPSPPPSRDLKHPASRESRSATLAPSSSRCISRCNSYSLTRQVFSRTANSPARREQKSSTRSPVDLEQLDDARELCPFCPKPWFGALARHPKAPEDAARRTPACCTWLDSILELVIRRATPAPSRSGGYALLRSHCARSSALRRRTSLWSDVGWRDGL